MIILSLILSFFSINIVDVHPRNYSLEEETFITNETPVFFDLEMLNIPFSIFEQEINTNENRVVALYPHENYVFIYIWGSRFLGSALQMNDQVVMNFTNNQDSTLNFSRFGNVSNGSLSVVKTCDVLNISVLAFDIQTTLLDSTSYKSDWVINLSFLRAFNRIFVNSQSKPFSASFSLNKNQRNQVESIDFEIHEISVLLSRYHLYQVNIPRETNLFNEFFSSDLGYTLDLFFWNFDFPFEIDNIHSATFNFTTEYRQRNRMLPFGWGAWFTRETTPRENVVIEPGIFHNRLLENLEFNFFATGSERISEFSDKFNVENYFGFDFSILIYVSDFYSTPSTIALNRHQRGTFLTETALIDMLFDSNGTMYRAIIDLENGPIDSERVIPTTNLPFLSIWFVVAFWSFVSLMAIGWSKKIEVGAAIFLLALASWFFHVKILYVLFL